MRRLRHTIPSVVGAVALAAFAASGCTFDGSGGAGPGQVGGDAGDAPAGDPDGALAADAMLDRADASPVAGVLQSVRVATPPTLDGDVDAAWDAAPAIGFRMLDAAVLEVHHPSYTGDAEVRCRSMHDATHIYFLVEVDDGLLVDDSTQSFQDDAVELYLDGAGDGDGPYGDDDHWLILQSSGIYESLGPAAVGPAEGVVDQVEGGYRVELSLLRTELGMPEAADGVGFDLGLVDDDGLRGPNADAYGIWYAADDGPGCATCCAEAASPGVWCDTSLLGRLVLVD